MDTKTPETTETEKDASVKDAPSKAVVETTTDTESEVKVRVHLPPKVKKFASASEAKFHQQVNKAKRVGLLTLEKVATWLMPKKR
jgi:hypothetical protein